MIAILLAAGVGKRMGPAAPPKCLLRVGGQTLLRRTLDALRAAGVTRVAIVVGYQAEAIESEARRHAHGLRLTILNNPRYREGAILSLWTARDVLTDAALVMDADVLCPPAFIERLVRSPSPNCLLVDQTSVDTGEEQLVFGASGRVLDITKRPGPELRDRLTCYGESVGFLKISREAAVALHGLLEERVQAGQVTLEHEQVYPALFHQFPVGHVSVDGMPWTEIDTPEDLKRAEAEILPRWDSHDCLNRVMAQWFLPFIVRWPVTPNQWTFVSLLLGLASVWVMSQEGYGAGLVGAALFQAFYVVDIWDGEVARAKALSSKWGGWLDVTVDGVVQTLLPIGLAVGAWRAEPHSGRLLALGAVAVAGMMLDFAVTMMARARGFGPGVVGDPSRQAPHGPLPAWLQKNLTHENFSLVVALMLILNMREPFLWLLAIGTHVFWMQYGWVERRPLTNS